MKKEIIILCTIAAAAVASAQENPLAASSRGDWAKYLITKKNETIPLMSSTNQPRWVLVSSLGEGFVRTDSYVMFGGRRANGGGDLLHTKERFEPVPGLTKSAKIDVISTTKENLTIKDKQYHCTKIVRKIEQALDEKTLTVSWIGTSTIWVSADVPLGLARMENTYETTMSKSGKPNKIVETWVVDECGFKNWQ